MKMFKEQGKHYIFVQPEPKSQRFPIFEEFCQKTKESCFYTHEYNNKTMRYINSFLGHKQGTETLYYIDNEIMFPSKKYKIENFEGVKQLLSFEKKIRRGSWDRFYVS